jgi:toxin-antitoxin system PIN domain toxin
VNVYVHAFRDAAPDHDRYRAWLRAALVGEEPVAVSELVLSGFVRVVTHPRVFDPPDPVAAALAFAAAVLAQPAAVVVGPGDRHWAIFANLCRSADARGNLVADAYLAALAIEAGAELITADRDFSRFPGLRWRHPLADA